MRRVFDVLELVEDHVAEAVADLLHPADVDGLHNVARRGIDRHRPARAVPLHPLGSGDERSAIGLAAGLLQRLVDEVHAVIAADREEVGVALELRVEGLDEFLVELVVEIVVVVPGGDDADRGGAHALQRGLVDHFAGADDLDLVRIDAAFGERLAECRRLRAAGHEDEDRFRV